jgi:hypothetical protein
MFRTFLAAQSRIPFADQLRRIVIKEGQESKAPAARDPADLVQTRTGKHDRATWGRLEATRSVFGKADLAAVEIVIQICRHSKAPKRIA